MALQSLTVNRVLVEDDVAIPPQEAARRGIFADVLFIRDDGWVLGAPLRLAEHAERMWRREWTHRILIPVRPGGGA